MRRPWLLDLFTARRRVRRVVLTPYQPPAPAAVAEWADQWLDGTGNPDGRPRCPRCRAPYNRPLTITHRLCDSCRATGDVA